MVSQNELRLKKFGVREFDTDDDCAPSSLLPLSLALIALSSLSGITFLYAALVSKMLPYSGYSFLDAIKNDEFFCYFIPLSILPTYLVIYLVWLSMTFFENN